MRNTLAPRMIGLAIAAGTISPAGAAQWRAETVPTPGPVRAVETVNGEAHILIGGGWFRIVVRSHAITLAATAKPLPRPRPAGFLPDGRIAEGRNDIARAWLAEPGDIRTGGPFGDAPAAGALVIEGRDRRQETVRAGEDAVFEDRDPRMVQLMPGRDHVVVVKSYRERGAALAIVGDDGRGRRALAETPPDAPGQWLNPVGAADFDGDGIPDLALVRGPHHLGVLELWSWRGDRLEKRLALADTTNHVAATPAQRMAAIADLDGDGRPDLAIPSFDRTALRLVAFAPQVRDLARVVLPSPAATESALVADGAGQPVVLLGLQNGLLIAVKRIPGS